MNSLDIALFPIPGSVSLPFEKVPLHIFEPRYRQMIQDCVSAQRRVGVAHTQGVISESKVSATASREEFLKSNHATYRAHPVFSAGFVRIVETLADGRIIAEIEMDSRYEMLAEIQTLPYKIVGCRLYKDNFEDFDVTLRNDVEKLLALAAGPRSAAMEKILSDPDWTDLSLFEFSFRIYSLVSVDPDRLQKVLELRSTNDRIEFLKDVLTPSVLN